MNEKIVEYYNQSQIDYELIWGLKKHLSIHYGFYDKKHPTHGEAVLNFNRILATNLSITGGDIVLDAGCGIGGSSIWLAKNYGCKVIGITVVPDQVKQATKLAKLHGVDHLVSFELQDYTKTSLSGESFTVVWGLESV